MMDPSQRVWSFEEAAARFDELAEAAFSTGPQYFADADGKLFVVVAKGEYDRLIRGREP